MSTKTALNPSIATAAALLGLAAVSWWWHATVVRAIRPVNDAKPQGWEHVKDDYPMPADPTATEPATTLAQEVVDANPFSAQRHIPPPSATASAGTGEPQAAPDPVLVYKGHLNLGNRQRAIVEDTASRKTYFLEVGQEVAGFKVLDITETQVIVSNLQTREELALSLSAKKSP